MHEPLFIRRSFMGGRAMTALPPFSIDALPAVLRPIVTETLSQAHDETLMSGAIALMLSRIGAERPVTAEDIERRDIAFSAIAEFLTSRMDEHDQMVTVSFMDNIRALMAAAPSRNCPCPCGSGRKLKRCCGR